MIAVAVVAVVLTGTVHFRRHLAHIGWMWAGAGAF
jgi:hypothetical protein